MRLSSVALLPLVPAVVGCAGTVSGGTDSADAEGVARTQATIVVERTAEPAGGARAEASARFLRVSGSVTGDEALRAIGASLDLPAIGTCAAISTRAASPAPDAVPVVELVDVGGVSLEAAGIETRLSPRQLPDVTDVVSGIVYARATDAQLLPAGTRYTVRVAGSAGIEPFEVTALAPSDPSEVRVSGEDEGGVVAARGATIDLTWSAGAADDLVYVDVRPGGVRCVLGETGRGSVSTVFLDDTGTLVVHRLHREPLRARGVDAGELRFDFARSLGYSRR